MEKIFRVTHVSDAEGVEFVAYQQKDVVYQWYGKWEELIGEDAEPTIQEQFLEAFLDHFFSQELKKAMVEEFVNLKQGKMSVNEYEIHPVVLLCPRVGV